MSLINTEIKPFTATAYHNGAFVDVSEADLKGKWSVVFFYPADFTFVCPTELGDLADLYADFQNDVRLSVGDIQTNVDLKRDQAKSLLVSKIFDNQDFGYLKITVERPLRLNFTVNDERIDRVKGTAAFRDLVISRKRKVKKEIEVEILLGEAAQTAIHAVLDGMKTGFSDRRVVKDRAAFETELDTAFEQADIPLDAKLRGALLGPGGLGEKDPTAEICRDRKGNPETDADLRDTENMPFPAAIALPLPLDYEGKKNKGKVDVALLLKQVKAHCEAYLGAEVLPYRADAWIDHNKIKVGYEIPFNRHFYEYEPPRPLAEIEADIVALEQDIMAMLKAVTA